MSRFMCRLDMRNHKCWAAVLVQETWNTHHCFGWISFHKTFCKSVIFVRNYNMFNFILQIDILLLYQTEFNFNIIVVQLTVKHLELGMQYFDFLWDKVSCSSGWPLPPYVSAHDPGLLFFLPVPTKYWDDRHATPCFLLVIELIGQYVSVKFT